MKTSTKNNKNKSKVIAKKETINKKQYIIKKKNYKLRRIIAFTLLGLVIIGLLIAILLSDLFIIKKITVLNNEKISVESIVENSKLVIGNNMFKTLNRTTKNGIKTEPYIERVNVHKKLNGEVIIEVEERKATYMLMCESGYAYINNQGYILEVTDKDTGLPIIKGSETQNIIPGERLIESDLAKLEVVIQIMESARSNNIFDKIKSININDKNNFILEIPTENKTVQFGDSSNINVKILWIVDLLERTKGTSGEIVLNVPDIKKVYFRESV